MASETDVYIAGAYEHPTRESPDTSTMALHAEVARGALDDAGLGKDNVDGYFTAGVPEVGEGIAPLVMAEYLSLDVGYADTTDHGGSSYVSHVGHVTAAIRDGRCDVALVTLAARPRSRARETGTSTFCQDTLTDSFENLFGHTVVAKYAMAARRHMHEFGTSSEQLANVRRVASQHAQHNENALYRDPVTVEEVLESRTVADPLHLLDCCLISDGGGAFVLVSDDIRPRIERECVAVLGNGETVKHHDGGRPEFTHTGAGISGRRAFAEAGVATDDVDYASVYDSFTITVVQTLEDLGFCAKGEGGEFVSGDTLKAPYGELPLNTDGGSLCSNHPDRGGMTKVVEAVRQLRGEATPETQVEDPDIALAHGTGGGGIDRHQSATTILGRCG